MDTSKEYIQMCDCPEIQDGWKPISGDFMTDELHQKPVNMSYTPAEYFWKTLKEKNERLIWLPRQDQLQDMLKDKHETIWDMIEDFWKWTYEEASQKSMEQLWLAFYMQEKHSLKWKEGKWV